MGLETVGEAFWDAWWGVVVLLMIVGGYLNLRSLRCLREDHPEVYKALGSPTFFRNRTDRNNRLMDRFFRAGRYRELGDPFLTRICRAERVISAVGLTMIFGPILLTILSKL